ncbi:carbohydrate ABC transporter permease [Fusibacter ferrireducens]|uniref:Carbohydrate ABC transporter permease n=1 Tax=Fusibacter ferrireducens TaxID=2785058 RepID=A0ABR9ZTP4_9FIRM|nr:carbohydrate ABC transporter permease [Fusibacter ferrireducens]MBF4693822.1 carbohydrate ABC transporter permease [Fusibacter ferrireducens]
MSVNLLKGIRHVFLMFVSLIFAFPFIWMIFGIFKTNNEIWQEPYKILPNQFNFGEMLANLETLHFENYAFNSIFVGIVGSALMIWIALMFSYAIVFMNSKGMKILFWIVLGTYMLPSAVTYVPAFVILAKMKLVDTLTGLIFSNLASVFAVFWLRQSLLKTDRSYVEAARIDGASHMEIIRHVIFPLNKSAIYTVFVLTFVQQYNSYMWPSIMLKSQDKYLISQGLRQFFIQDGAYGMNWSQIMLASTMAILPIIVIFILTQKWFLTGIKEDSGTK